MVAIATSPGSGWVNYKWPSPVTNKIEDRSAYIEKMGDYLVGVGMDR
jgi:cytochrome c